LLRENELVEPQDARVRFGDLQRRLTTWAATDRVDDLCPKLCPRRALDIQFHPTGHTFQAIASPAGKTALDLGREYQHTRFIVSL
jgi:hypothetical protein